MLRSLRILKRNGKKKVLKKKPFIENQTRSMTHSIVDGSRVRRKRQKVVQNLRLVDVT